MNQGSSNCYLATVPTTNWSGDSFSIDGDYYDCEGGEVYVIADSLEEAARTVPCATAIERVGFALGKQTPND